MEDCKDAANFRCSDGDTDEVPIEQVEVFVLGFDIETNGKTHKAEITEIGVVSYVMKDFAVVAGTESLHKNWLVYCDGDISAELVVKVGIKKVDLKNQKRFPDVMREVAAWIKENSGDRPVVFLTFNGLKFDMRIIAYQLARFGMNVEQWFVDTCTFAHEDFYVVAKDTFALRHLNLGAVHELLVGVSFENAHSAKADARAVMDCFLAYCQISKAGKNYPLSFSTIDYLLSTLVKDWGKLPALPAEAVYIDPPKREATPFNVGGFEMSYCVDPPF